VSTTIRRDRGATLPIVALLLPVLILMTSFAIDLGRQRSSRRTMQARADVVSLDMIRLADGRSEDQITGVDASGGTTPVLYQAYIQQSADRNGVERSKLTIEWGTWNGTAFVQTLGAAIPNAVEVTAQETTEYFFQPGSGNAIRTAVATRDDLTHLSLGSTLLQADLGNSALLNPILTGLLCGAPAVPPPVALCPHQANIGAGGYDGLATHDVTLDDLKTAGGFGSVDDLLQEDLTVAEFAVLAAQAFRNNGDPTTADLYDAGGTSLAGLSSALSGTFRMENVMDVQSPADGAAADADVNPFNVIMSGLEVSNGNNFVDLSNAIPPVSLPAGVSNLALTSRYQLIETPVEGIGRVGSSSTMPPTLRTAQIRLVHSLTFTLNLSILGTGISGPVTIPIDVTGGGAEATLTAINCTQPDTSSTIDVTTAPRPVVGTVGTFFTPANPATIGNVNLTVGGLPAGNVGLSAYGAVDPALQTTGAANLPGIAIGETRSAPGSAFALGGAVSSVKIQSALGGLSSLNLLVGTTLNGLLTSLDTATRPALNALGVSVSSSDVRNHDVDCQAVRLAA
jgi:uncharacterized membrane protein